MSRPLLISALILVLGGGALAQSAPAPAAKRQVRKAVAAKPKAGKAQKEAEPEVPAPPPTPEQMPPVAPQVSFSGGQLLINAQNSTLADVLAAVRRQTGAAVEVPPGAQSERVFARLGPGSPHDVLAQLLDGSKFDYIVLAAPERPNAIQYVKVTPKRGGPPTPPSAVAGARPAPTSQPEEEIIDEEIPDESTVMEEQPEEPQQPQPGQPGQAQPGQPVQQVQPGQQQPEGVKSPEQLLEELRRLQQMQQEQIQQQLNPANRIPPDNQQQPPNDPNNPDRNPPEGEQPE